MTGLPLLLPMPRELSLASNSYLLEDRRLIILDTPDLQALLFSARRLQACLRADAGLSWEISAAPATSRDQIGVTLSLVPGGVRHPQGYELTIAPAGIHAVAGTAAGIFYAVCTLIQLLQSSFDVSKTDTSILMPAARAGQLPAPSFELPALRISDWPDFPARGDARRQSGSRAGDGHTL